jgi:hypothetical protein
MRATMIAAHAMPTMVNTPATAPVLLKNALPLPPDPGRFNPPEGFGMTEVIVTLWPLDNVVVISVVILSGCEDDCDEEGVVDPETKTDVDVDIEVMSLPWLFVKVTNRVVPDCVPRVVLLNTGGGNDVVVVPPSLVVVPPPGVDDVPPPLSWLEDVESVVVVGGGVFVVGEGDREVLRRCDEVDVSTPSDDDVVLELCGEDDRGEDDEVDVEPLGDWVPEFVVLIAPNVKKLGAG